MATTNALWKNRRVRCSNEEPCSFGGNLKTRMSELVFLIDWDDGSTSTGVCVCDVNELNSKMLNDGDILIGRFAVPADSPSVIQVHQDDIADKTSEGVITPLLVAPLAVPMSPVLLVQIRLLSLVQTPEWFQESDVTHQTARFAVATVAFDIIMKIKSKQTCMKKGSEVSFSDRGNKRNQTLMNNKDNYRFLEEAQKIPKDRASRSSRSSPSSSGRIHHPPTAAESASKWATSEAVRLAKLSSSTITSPCHTAAYIERKLLESTTSFQSFISYTNSNILEAYLLTLDLVHNTTPISNEPKLDASNSEVKHTNQGKKMKRNKSPIPQFELNDFPLTGTVHSSMFFQTEEGEKGGDTSEKDGVLQSVLKFMRWHGVLENCRFYEGDCWWRVLRCGMDQDTDQKVVYYYEDKLNEDQTRCKREISGDESEWSSLKEVWSWVMRSTALTFPKNTSARNEVSRVNQYQKVGNLSSTSNEMSLEEYCGFTAKELLELADSVEHTSICDQLLSGSVEEDVSILEVNDIIAMMKSIIKLMKKPPLKTTALVAETNGEKLRRFPSRSTATSTGATEQLSLETSGNDLVRMEELLYEALLNALNSIDIPENVSRLNVKRDSSQRLEAMCIGAVSCRANGIQASVHTRERPNLTKLLIQFGKFHIEREIIKQKSSTSQNSAINWNQFTFSSIQVNKNYAAAVHVDRNNEGPSIIVGIGNYVGGELWTYDKGPLDIKNKLAYFDGNLPHGVLCFSGTRYSLTYFTVKHHERILHFHRQKLKEFGFLLPTIFQSKPVNKEDQDKYRAGAGVGTMEEAEVETKVKNKVGCGILESGQSAFASWLKMNHDKTNAGWIGGSHRLVCGPNCKMMLFNQTGSTLQTSKNYDFQFNEMLKLLSPEQKEHELWLNDLDVGDVVEARYLKGRSYYKGKIVNVHKLDIYEEDGVALGRSELATEKDSTSSFTMGDSVNKKHEKQEDVPVEQEQHHNKWLKFDIHYDDGDNEYNVESCLVREYVGRRYSGTTYIVNSSSLSLSPRSASLSSTPTPLVPQISKNEMPPTTPQVPSSSSSSSSSPSLRTLRKRKKKSYFEEQILEDFGDQPQHETRALLLGNGSNSDSVTRRSLHHRSKKVLLHPKSHHRNSHCPLLVSLNSRTSFEKQSRGNCWSGNIDEELNEVAAKFPVGTKFYDEKQTSPCRVIDSYRIGSIDNGISVITPRSMLTKDLDRETSDILANQTSVKNVVGEAVELEKITNNRLTWLVRTSPFIENKLLRNIIDEAQESDNESDNENDDDDDDESNILDYFCVSSSQKTMLEECVRLQKEREIIETKQQRELKTEISRQARLEAPRLLLMSKFPPGTLLFDFDVGIFELRVVVGVIWIDENDDDEPTQEEEDDKEEEDCILKDTTSDLKETDVESVNQSEEMKSESKSSKRKRGSWSIITAPVVVGGKPKHKLWLEPLLVKAMEILKTRQSKQNQNKEEGEEEANQKEEKNSLSIKFSQKLGWVVNGCAIPDEDIESYLMDDKYQIQDLEDMVQAALQTPKTLDWIKLCMLKPKNKARSLSAPEKKEQLEVEESSPVITAAEMKRQEQLNNKWLKYVREVRSNVKTYQLNWLNEAFKLKLDNILTKPSLTKTKKGTKKGIKNKKTKVKDSKDSHDNNNEGAVLIYDASRNEVRKLVSCVWWFSEEIDIATESRMKDDACCSENETSDTQILLKENLPVISRQTEMSLEWGNRSNGSSRSGWILLTELVHTKAIDSTHKGESTPPSSSMPILPIASSELDQELLPEHLTASSSISSSSLPSSSSSSSSSSLPPQPPPPAPKQVSTCVELVSLNQRPKRGAAEAAQKKIKLSYQHAQIVKTATENLISSSSSLSSFSKKTHEKEISSSMTQMDLVAYPVHTVEERRKLDKLISAYCKRRKTL